MLTRLFKRPALSKSAIARIQEETERNLGVRVSELLTEWCIYVQTVAELGEEELETLVWMLVGTSKKSDLSPTSFLPSDRQRLEVGPRLNFETAWSTTAVSGLRDCGLQGVIRVERSLRLAFAASKRLTKKQIAAFLAPLHDRMTQMQYLRPLQSFDSGLAPAPVEIVPIVENGMAALEEINRRLGLAMDEQDLQIWHNLFANDLRRNPTDSESFLCGAMHSEHCRHGCFRGILVINGQQMPQSLMQIVRTPWETNPNNSVIAFHDDSSAIRGFRIDRLMPSLPGKPSAYQLANVLYHLTLTAETHNHPTLFEPYEGAATGGEGRRRDNMCVGCGGLMLMDGVGYCTDNLGIDGYPMPWEDKWRSPSNVATPLQILIRGSDGVSDDGNKFGIPLTFGFLRTFGQVMPDKGEGRRGWIKPVLYTVGGGMIDDRHTKKSPPKKGMLLVRIGGPDYRIGMGGGPASSLMAGENDAELDFNSVQRCNSWMGQIGYRVVEACIEMGNGNPFVSAHDLGAVGNINAFSESMNPAGGVFEIREVPLGDKTLSVLEIGGNESQERNAFLIWPDRFDELKAICDRESVSCVIVGRITDDGMLIFHDASDGSTPINLPIDKVLGAIPVKTWNWQRTKRKRVPLRLPKKLTVRQALDLVLRLPSVASKRFLTTKVDRSVSGLVAQQQCVGPNQLTLCDYAISAMSHFETSGVAYSLGEQPIIGLISPAAMARMAVAEALLNMAGAKITSIPDIRCEANWMVPAKLPGEGAWMYDAAVALRDILVKMESAVDGGKDSLSMAAKALAPRGEPKVVKAPGQLVIANYAPMPDITCHVTPDLKGDKSSLIWVDLARGKNRLGGSALAQVHSQIGDECPDIEDVGLLVRGFNAVQYLLERELITAVHDRCHHGGLITTILEMAFAGNKGISVSIFTEEKNTFKVLFGEEAGLVIECDEYSLPMVLGVLRKNKVPAQMIGAMDNLCLRNPAVTIAHNGAVVLQERTLVLRDIWEETSHRIELHDARINPEAAKQERAFLRSQAPANLYCLSFRPFQRFPMEELDTLLNKPRVAILRAPGSNGHREMASAFKMAGFDPVDVIMSDLTKGRITLDGFRGLASVGGFTYMDTLGAGGIWSGIVRFNRRASRQFRRFFGRKNTFSLGVCNGCQFMALLGQLLWPDLKEEQMPRFVANTSGRFEQRYPAVTILRSPAIMLKGMEGSILPILTAHGEGRCVFPDESVLDRFVDQDLAPIRFVDARGDITEQYPLNPNGSKFGITALCGRGGRDLIMMPHPERLFLRWQLEAFYWPPQWDLIRVSPWFQLFQNAYDWCAQ